MQNQNVCAPSSSLSQIFNFWRIACWDSVKGKIEIFTFPHLSAKNFHRQATFLSKESFWNSLNTFEDIAFLLGQCKGKIEIFTFSGYWKSCNVAIAKPKSLGTLKFSTTIATFLIFQPKEGFWKFVKYFWRYSISAGTV